MTIRTILSYLGGYFKSSTYEVDIPKVADIAELFEEDVINELEELQANGDIDLDENKVTLIKISPRTNKKFNAEYRPVETMVWDKGAKLKLDK